MLQHTTQNEAGLNLNKYYPLVKVKLNVFFIK